MPLLLALAQALRGLAHVTGRVYVGGEGAKWKRGPYAANSVDALKAFNVQTAVDTRDSPRHISRTEYEVGGCWDGKMSWVVLHI